MLNDLFPRHHQQYEESRYGAELETFATWMATKGHLRHPLRLHLHRAKEVLEPSEQFQSGAMFNEADLLQAFVVPGPLPSNCSAYDCPLPGVTCRNKIGKLSHSI